MTGVGLLLMVALFAAEPSSLHGVLALTVAAICVALLAGLRPQPLAPATVRRAVRAAEGAVHPRHSDPDAAGRPRPRAPARG